MGSRDSKSPPSTGSDPPAIDLTAAWGEVRDSLSRALPASAFKLWIEPLRAVGIDGGQLLLAGPERVRRWTERRYSDLLVRTLSARIPGVSGIRFLDAASVGDPTSTQPAGPELNPAYTFESFVIGSGNRFAHSAALNVAEAPGEAYNPLFLYGPPGLGKTHLLVAIAHYLRATHPELKVLYTTAEAFTQEFVGAMRRQGGERFKERHREIGALLIDDVQFLEGKPGTEEEFFHTFNALYESGSQIVLSSDRPPSALERLAERLRDRFQWGLTAELSQPDLRTRLAVLRRLVLSSAARPEEDVLQEIASIADGNLRQLQGALTRVTAFSSLIGAVPSRDLVREMLGSGQAGEPATMPRLGPPGREPPSIAQIIQAVCSTLHVSQDDLLSPRRTPDVVRARHLAIYVSRELTESSVQEIARAFGRDHSTVLHALSAVNRKLSTGPDLDATLSRTSELLGIQIAVPDRG